VQDLGLTVRQTVDGGPRPIEVQPGTASDVLQVRSAGTDLRLGPARYTAASSPDRSSTRMVVPPGRQPDTAFGVAGRLPGFRTGTPTARAHRQVCRWPSPAASSRLGAPGAV
jgi:hypothetical protein